MAPSNWEHFGHVTVIYLLAILSLLWLYVSTVLQIKIYMLFHLFFANAERGLWWARGLRDFSNLIVLNQLILAKRFYFFCILQSFALNLVPKSNPRSWTGQHWLVFIDSKLCETIGVGCRVYPRKKGNHACVTKKKKSRKPS